MTVVGLLDASGHGPVWGVASDDLNVTLLVWRPGEGQPEHVNSERDVVVVVVAGSGTLAVDGEPFALLAGSTAIVPRGARRSITAGEEGIRYVSVHLRRGGLAIERRLGSAVGEPA